MGQFYETDKGVGGMTADALDKVALDDAGVVGRIAFGYATRKEVGRLAGGWTARWIATGGMGNAGTLVLSPVTARARAVYREGQMRAFERAGLNRRQAERLYHARARYKHELLPLLAEVLVNRGMTRAFLAHPGTYGAGSGRGDWLRAWGAAFGAEGLGLSAPREAELAAMVVACSAV